MAGVVVCMINYANKSLCTVRGRCDGGAWQVWGLLLVASASNTIADYHLLHQ